MQKTSCPYGQGDSIVDSPTAFAFFRTHVFFFLQDNEPLMRALSKLINLNSPDLVLFVGEALVGNDAVDQLSKFNQVQSLTLDT